MIANKTVAFHTLGCKVNQYDTQAMRERFEEAGCRTVEFEEMADIYVVNTCTVTGTGDKKSMQTIRRCHRKNPEAAIVVTGCLAQRAADELKLPGVRLVLGTQRRGEVVQLLAGERLTGALIRNVHNGEVTQIHAEGLFVSVGRKPASYLFAGQAETDETGYIVADETTKTNLPGVYAVGDVRVKRLRQVVTAVADGAAAVHEAEEYLAALKG